MGYTDEEKEYTEEMNRQIFEEKMEQASKCPRFGHINMYACDRCDLIEVCLYASNCRHADY